MFFEPATSYNSGHTSPLRSAQIPHLWFGTSDVRQPLYEMAGAKRV